MILLLYYIIIYRFDVSVGSFVVKAAGEKTAAAAAAAESDYKCERAPFVSLPTLGASSARGLKVPVHTFIYIIVIIII